MKVEFTKKQGFTLIELLIAISVIAIISAIGIASYGKAQLIGRDARRKQDLRAIATALDIYYQQNKRYPSSVNAWEDSTQTRPWLRDNASPAINFDTNYINNLPTDPINISPTNMYLYYSVPGVLGTGCSANNFYYLMAPLENNNDSDLYIKKPFDICGTTAATIISNSAWSWITDKYFILGGS